MVYIDSITIELPHDSISQTYNLTDESKVILIMAGTRENFWDTLKRYIK